MLNELFTLTRPLYVLDTETTGVNVREDRIIELGFQQWTAEGMTKEWRTLINPGIPIPAEATAVHGITDEQVTGCRTCGRSLDAHLRGDDCGGFKGWPKFAQIAPNLKIGLVDCDFAGMNVRFDLQIMFAEMQREKVDWNYRGARIIDASRLESLAVPRSLSHLHEKYVGMKHDGAHGALSDVRASTTVIVSQLQQYEVLPRTLDELHAAQWPNEWLDNEGKFRMVNGVPTCCFGKKYANVAMRNIPIDFYDWLLRSDFPSDVLELARDAKLGKFPER